MKIKSVNRKSAYTLVELIVSIFCLLVIMGVLSGIGFITYVALHFVMKNW